MAIFSNTGNGGTKVSGCALITYCKTYLTLYAPGDITYNIHKAKRGVLEKAVIKRHKIINANKTGGIFQVMYVDTLNGLWNEWDLISHSQAIALATAYYEGLLEDASKLKC
jgi:hypothetical protein